MDGIANVIARREQHCPAARRAGCVNGLVDRRVSGVLPSPVALNVRTSKKPAAAGLPVARAIPRPACKARPVAASPAGALQELSTYVFS